MQIVIKFPFRKTLLVLIFIALLFTAGYNIAMMIMGHLLENSGTSIFIVRQIVDIILWFVLAVWFLSLLLYGADKIGHKGLNIMTSISALTVFAKAFLSILLVLGNKPPVLTVIFSILEMIICIGLLVCMVNIWFRSSSKA